VQKYSHTTQISWFSYWGTNYQKHNLL